MISLEDCIAFSGLSEEEILAIAEYEHIPEIAAAALGAYLLGTDQGPRRIRDMIRDDIRLALARGDRGHAQALLMALHHYLETHPEGRLLTEAAKAKAQDP